MSILGIGIGCMGFSFWAMIPDTVEYGEWKNNVRAEAVLFGLGLFFLKIGLGLGSFILGLLLEHYDYQANIKQSLSTMGGIHLMTTLALFIPALATILIMLRYKLTENMYNKIFHKN